MCAAAAISGKRNWAEEPQATPAETTSWRPSRVSYIAVSVLETRVDGIDNFNSGPELVMAGAQWNLGILGSCPGPRARISPHGLPHLSSGGK